MGKIEDLREEVNILDERIMVLLEKRFQLTDEIGEVKKQSNIKILDSKREEVILAKLSNFSHFPELKAIYMEIMSESKKSQNKG